MRRRLATFFALLFACSVLLPAQGALADGCDPALVEATQTIFLNHNGNDYQPKLKIWIQNGGICQITGDYVWGRFQFDNVVNENGAADAVSVNLMKLIRNSDDLEVDGCDSSNPGDSDGWGCNNGWHYMADNPNYVQTDKHNCSHTPPVTTYRAQVKFTVLWHNHDTAVYGPYTVLWWINGSGADPNNCFSE